MQPSFFLAFSEMLFAEGLLRLRLARVAAFPGSQFSRSCFLPRRISDPGSPPRSAARGSPGSILAVDPAGESAAIPSVQVSESRNVGATFSSYSLR